jgi:hypothetical protein
MATSAARVSLPDIATALCMALVVLFGPEGKQSFRSIRLEDGNALAILSTPNRIRIAKSITIASNIGDEAISQRVAEHALTPLFFATAAIAGLIRI